MAAPYIELQIKNIRTETSDTKSFVLEPMGEHSLKYQPGQFLTLVFPKKINEERRSYSISSCHLLDEPLTITVKRIDNGEFSRLLFDKSEVGSSLFTIGASGFFTLPADPNSFSTYTFFAAGSGITPILPLIKTILYKCNVPRINLVYSNASIGSTIFHHDLIELQRQFTDRFTIDFLFSNAKNLMKARLNKLLVGEYVKRIGNQDDRLYYMCGPNDYMQMIGITLLTEGVPARNIRREIFDTIKPVLKDVPPDQEPHNVTVEYNGVMHIFVNQYPRTILQSAKEYGLVLPYSCEAGKCGTCAATCTSGKVWMSYNEVLLDKEIAEGRVLTCTGFAVAGNVTLQFPTKVN